jgi:hypothetical protein
MERTRRRVTRGFAITAGVMCGVVPVAVPLLLGVPLSYLPPLLLVGVSTGMLAGMSALVASTVVTEMLISLHFYRRAHSFGLSAHDAAALLTESQFQLSEEERLQASRKHRSPVLFESKEDD